MRVVAVALIFIAHSAWGSPFDPRCGTQPNRDPLLEVLMRSNISAMMLKSVNAEEVESARCLSSLPDLNALEKWFEGKESSLTSASYLGIKFENQNPELISLFKELVPEGSVVNASAGACRTVFCAADAILGENVGAKLIYILGRYGLNGSPLAINKTNRRLVNKADSWTEPELNSILLGLLDSQYLPENPRTRKPLMRYKRGEVLPRPPGSKPLGPSECMGANSTFKFFDCFFAQPKAIQRMEAFHELAHHGTETLGYEFEPTGAKALSMKATEWLALSAWKKTGGDGAQTKWESENRRCLISGYSLEGPHEDIVESMSLYRYNPARLKEACPQKYDYLKANLFRGREYLNQQQCEWVARSNGALQRCAK